MVKLEKNITIGIGRYGAASPGVVSEWGNPFAHHPSHVIAALSDVQLQVD